MKSLHEGHPRCSQAVCPGTFDPFTDGHRDLVDRARRLFGHLTVLVAVNGDKRPTKAGAERAADIRDSLPADWENVAVEAWSGLTVAFCQQRGAGVIIRGVRNAGDAERELQLAATNEMLGLATLLMPARAELAATSSTAVRAAAALPSLRWLGPSSLASAPADPPARVAPSAPPPPSRAAVTRGCGSYSSWRRMSSQRSLAQARATSRGASVGPSSSQSSSSQYAL
jgi:pantetheine-phosphate adenylyltransferase